MVTNSIYLFSIALISYLDSYKAELWKSLSMNDGVKTLFGLSHSCDPTIAQFATDIINTLQLEGISLNIVRRLYNSKSILFRASRNL